MADSSSAQGLIAAVAPFFGSSAASVPRELARPMLSINDTSADDDGLRKLATAGSWHAVGALAERLEGRYLDAVTRFPTEQSLKYTVVRVQVYLRLQQYDAAKRVYDTLGNLKDSRFYVASSLLSSNAGVSARSNNEKWIVPFSLIMLHAQLPGLMGSLAESQGRLYELLEYCEEQQQLPVSGERLVWRQRSKRVRRALIANHFELEQFAASFKCMHELAETETNDLKHILSMQHLGCMCLKSGNSFLAAEVFRLIEKMPVDDETLDASVNREVAEAKEAMVAMNQSLLLCFHEYFGEACLTLRNIMSGVPLKAAVSETTDASEKEPTLHAARRVRTSIRRCAINSLVATLPFIHRNDAPDLAPQVQCNPSVTIATLGGGGGGSSGPQPPLPKTTVPSLIQFLEDHVRADLRGMLSIDATIQNMGRLYDLEGADAASTPLAPVASRHDVLDALIELFRANKDSCYRTRR